MCKTHTEPVYVYTVYRKLAESMSVFLWFVGFLIVSNHIGCCTLRAVTVNYTGASKAAPHTLQQQLLNHSNTHQPWQQGLLTRATEDKIQSQMCSSLLVSESGATGR